MYQHYFCSLNAFINQLLSYQRVSCCNQHWPHELSTINPLIAELSICYSVVSPEWTKWDQQHVSSSYLGIAIMEKWAILLWPRDWWNVRLGCQTCLPLFFCSLMMTSSTHRLLIGMAVLLILLMKIQECGLLSLLQTALLSFTLIQSSAVLTPSLCLSRIHWSLIQTDIQRFIDHFS